MAATIVAKNPALLGAVGGISGLQTVRQHMATQKNGCQSIAYHNGNSNTRSLVDFFLHRIPKLVSLTYIYTCLVEGQARVNLCLG